MNRLLRAVIACMSLVIVIQMVRYAASAWGTRSGSSVWLTPGREAPATQSQVQSLQTPSLSQPQSTPTEPTRPTGFQYGTGAGTSSSNTDNDNDKISTPPVVDTSPEDRPDDSETPPQPPFVHEASVEAALQPPPPPPPPPSVNATDHVGVSHLTHVSRDGAPPYADASVNLLLLPKSHAKKFWGPNMIAAWPATGNNCKLVKECNVQWKTANTDENWPHGSLFVAGFPWMGAEKWSNLLFLEGVRSHYHTRRGIPVGVLLTELDDKTERNWMKAFDFRASYQPDAELFQTQGCPSYLKLQNRLESMRADGGAREKLVAGFVTNCGPPAVRWRTEYIEAFNKLVSVDHYGGCWRNVDVPNTRHTEEFLEVKQKLLQKYRFALAFENKVQLGYVSEKVFDALVAGAIPIYYGSPDVLDYVPPGSVIDASKFGSVEELAQYVLKVDSDPALYQSYHNWNLNDVTTLLERFQCLDTLFCRVCEYLAWFRQGLRARRSPDKVPAFPWGANRLANFTRFPLKFKY